MRKEKIGNIFFGVGFLGLMYDLYIGLSGINGKERLNSAEGLLIFSGSMFSMIVGGLISGEIGARGLVVRREEKPAGYWVLIAAYALFALMVLTKGIKKLKTGL